MSPEQAQFAAQVVCLFSFNPEIQAARAAIRKRAKELSDVYTTGVELATAEWLLERCGGKVEEPDLSFLE